MTLITLTPFIQRSDLLESIEVIVEAFSNYANMIHQVTP